MDYLAEELRRGLAIRADALASKIEDHRGRLGNTRLPIADILDILAEFPRSLKHAVDQEWEHNPNPESRVEILRLLLVHLTEVTDLVDTCLSQDTQAEVPMYLMGTIERSCRAMGIEECIPIIVPGPASNYLTYVRDIRSILFDKLGEYCPELPWTHDTPQYMLMLVPQMESRNALWAPILLGHELAHLAVAKNEALRSLNLQTEFDHNRARLVQVPGIQRQDTDQAVMALYGIAENWAIELMCDAYAVRSFGIGAVASLSEYLDVVGAIDKVTLTHPPGRLRIELMLSWLQSHEACFDSILEPWRALESSGMNPSYPDWAMYLCELFRNSSTKIYNEANRWNGKSYVTGTRSTVVRMIASDLENGVPNDLAYIHDGVGLEVDEADVIAAAWLARVAGYKTPFAQLAQKGLDAREFVKRWNDAGGDWRSPIESSPDVSPLIEGPILSSEQIEYRLWASGNKRLIIRPYLQGNADGVSVDIRLGNEFIVFVRSRTSSFDPLRTDHYPRSMQRFLQLPWGETFVLHPHELVLAATLEYFVIPTDLTAQVVTRSSYGRLGLISATAVQIHPNFHGSLTLELVNLGTLPLELTPGERIAQLIFAKTAETTTPDAKYHCTVGPQFSRVHSDREAEILRRMARTDG